METCQPVRGALVDIWHANATGFYAGHPTPAEGFENEKPQVGGSRAGLLTAYPRTLFDEQWLRGAWPTDNHGVARFNTIFPGYYTGRATRKRFFLLVIIILDRIESFFCPESIPYYHHRYPCRGARGMGADEKRDVSVERCAVHRTVFLRR